MSSFRFSTTTTSPPISPDKTDFTQYVGAALTWSPCKNLSLSASVIQTWNLSNEAASSYSALDLGGTIALTWSL